MEHEQDERQKDRRLERASWIAAIGSTFLAALGIVVSIILSVSDNSPGGNGASNVRQFIEGDGNTINNVQNAGSGNVDIGTEVNIYLDDRSQPYSAMSASEQLSYAADLHKRGQDDDALTFLNECLEDSELDEETRAALRFNRGVCNYSLNYFSIAVDDFKYAAQVSGSAKAYWDLAEAHMMCGNYEEASTSYGQAYNAMDDSQASDKKRVQKRKDLADSLAPKAGSAN